MVSVTFIQPDGSARTVAGSAGTSVMETAMHGDIPGVPADCGGVLACATCHVHVAADWMDKVGTASGAEAEMLDLAIGTDDRSRLCCQIILSDDLDGLTVMVAGDQY